MKISGKEKWIVIVGATLVLIVPSAIALFAVGVGMSINNVEVRDLDKPEDPPPIVTLAEFGRIEKNMSYQEVRGIIDDPGIQVAPSTASEAADGDDEVSLYVWQNSDGSNMRATFQSGQLVAKEEVYLK